MSDPLAPLFAAAFRQAEPAEANAAILAARADAGSGDAEALSYEIVLPDGRELKTLVDKALPRLVYFLECRGAKLPDGAGVIVTLFARGRLSFFHAGDFVAEAALLAGLSIDELRERYGQHRTDIP